MEASAPPRQPAVVVEAVTKKFRVYDQPILGMAQEVLLPWFKPQKAREILAVDNVSLTVPKGEVFGIVGANGSGKTTLLKMIAGLLPADGGEIYVDGPVTTLLALGVGVYPEFSGRENVEYSGLLQGLSLKQIHALTDEIIAFSEIGDFADMPFRTYSSGMRARLLFSIAMAVRPEVLIVDEALATGDARFAAKSARRIREICDSGTTVIFVSHNVSHVIEFCDRAALMANGRFLTVGTPAEVISSYHGWLLQKDAKGAPLLTHSDFDSLRGSGEISMVDLKILDGEGKPTRDFQIGQSMDVVLRLRNGAPGPRGFGIFAGVTRHGGTDYICEINSRNYLPSTGGDPRLQFFEVEGETEVRLRLDRLLFAHGHYSLWIQVFDPKSFDLFSEYRHVGEFFVGNIDRPFNDGSVFMHPVDFSETRNG